MAIHVEIKTVPAVRVASISEKVTDYGAQEGLWRELSEYLKAHGVRPSGPLVGVDYSEGSIEDGIRLEVTAPIDVDLPESSRVRVYDLPELELAASTLHTGDPDGLGGAYRMLMFWLRDNGYRITGPSREIYLNYPVGGEDDPLAYLSRATVAPTGFVMEVLFPVERLWAARRVGFEPEPEDPA